MGDSGKVYIFGYGSLINLESLSRALKRVVALEDIDVAYLNGFTRAWTVKENVFFHELNSAEQAIFLDLVESPGQKMNGIVFEVSNEEFENLVKREKNYDMVDITKHVTPSFEGTVYTVFAKEEHLVKPGERAFVPKRYVEMVETACKKISSEFYKDYLESTEDYTKHSVVDGKYTFVHHEQAQYV